MSRTESSIFAKRPDWPRVFSKLGLVASSIGVFAFMPNARASDYSIAIGNGYQSVSRTPTGTGFGFLLDATRSGEDAYSIGSGLSFGVRIGAVSLTVAGKALHVRSADDRSGLTTPIGVIAGIPAASRLSLVARAFYTPRAVFSAALGAYTQATAGVRWTYKPINLEAGWRYEALKGRNGTRDPR
ncbi:hypothetical protein FKO59_22955 [Burkholderia pseudomallei]|uniref:YfaZ family outer membrane protein n=1 Tax=Burkholderia pseudomallei TaxID=28450 RepID=UPI001144E8FB|nr:YfaZ family outer membrane protein [Burkholderia pseudomallei]NRD81897.1 hypothetical protein [Burkholderia pseudomallei]QDH30349.1 hypothetical protein FKO42_22990 [Burkholderia pseudomallei]QDH40612.1 hypothetical protein FKO59_22955 [Burkholderia pseudomallei]